MDRQSGKYHGTTGRKQEPKKDGNGWGKALSASISAGVSAVQSVLFSAPTSKAPINILVLGETGCGKSTFINTLTNYFRGGSLKNLKIAIKTKFLDPTEEWNHSENDASDRTKSQTNACHTYSFSFEGTKYNIIDTPGLSDTRGTGQDDENLNNILETAENLDSLAAVILLLNGTNARMTINLKNVMVRLRNSIPDVALDNMVIVLTNCFKHESNFDPSELADFNTDHVFFMNNSAF
eukprot:TRINITY_DN20184_c0_g1::TRINITY_DN20184_c0_g1_i1::g.30328::m.30328 TRINITY_DN20184_c0_g1::TRINITY_DN20184_c0_g1_i1::g.30328  ORF type:complete len:237 (+),score=41.11,AIG1/PF04548.11/1.2e-11,MMR_HSR1/PF01926.18/1.2e-11,Dynamin_N/PF00350.18/0.12,Dynamin_N/PF00350.18/0.0021,DUF258/PF03193.11/6.8e-06,IIGP/PF05049.8/8.7e-06,G-alpha/PF00503.15/0.0033,G-alpha/PF00503.15/4.2,Septin/PF00735.13/2.8e-05,GTP_EFTU/PF00009.22/3.4e-05,FtsK_SpoIIIE/PF01580.13/0.00011,FeoB_N/PF02421.13/0.39,FeoB_N/PF02421.13/0.6